MTAAAVCLPGERTDIRQLRDLGRAKVAYVSDHAIRLTRLSTSETFGEPCNVRDGTTNEDDWFTFHTFVTISEHSRRLNLLIGRRCQNRTGKLCPKQRSGIRCVSLLQIPNSKRRCQQTKLCHVIVVRQLASILDPTG
jgi:hypothetical protein